MATAKLIQTHSKGAEIYHGKDVCIGVQKKILEEFQFPQGLLAVDEVEETGFNRSTGFFWIKQKKKNEHKFEEIGETIIYETLITGFVEQKHMRKLTGVKVKKLIVSVVVNDILVGAPSADMIKVTSSIGISGAHPISAFET